MEEKSSANPSEEARGRFRFESADLIKEEIEARRPLTASALESARGSTQEDQGCARLRSHNDSKEFNQANY